MKDRFVVFRKAFVRVGKGNGRHMGVRSEIFGALALTRR